MDKTAVKILLVENNPLDAKLIREIMKDARILTFDLDCADDLGSAMARLSAASFDAVLTDLTLPDSRGFETFWKLHNHSPSTPIIILTGTDDEMLALELVQKGAQDYLVKGQLNRNQIERSVGYALERNKIIDELNKSRESLVAMNEELERALRSINQELEIARRVQKAFLPQDTCGIPGMDFCALSMPSGRIGGDLYDIIQIDDHCVGILLLDVAGHGIPAALISAMAKLSFVRHIMKGIEPQEIFQRVNSELIHYMPPERFVTAFLGILDIRSKKLTYARAGNPPALLCRAATGSCDILSTGGSFIGLFSAIQFEQKSMTLMTGDKVVLYTDGLVECLDQQGNQFGRRMLEDTALKSLKCDADETVVAIRDEIRTYTEGKPYSDDITVMVLHVL